MSDSIGSKTFTTTPQFNVTLLKDSPVQEQAEWGDWRDTTYISANAPAFTGPYILVGLGHLVDSSADCSCIAQSHHGRHHITGGTCCFATKRVHNFLAGTAEPGQLPHILRESEIPLSFITMCSRLPLFCVQIRYSPSADQVVGYVHAAACR